MEPVDVSNSTFGFKAPSSAADRKAHLFVMRCVSLFRRKAPLLRGIIGAALFFGILFWTGAPSSTNLGFAIGVLVLWFFLIWAFSGRDRLAMADVPELLTKQGLKSDVLTRHIVTEARNMLQSVREPELSPDLDLRPPPEGEIPGFKVSFTLVSGVIREALNRSPNVINTEVVQTGATAFEIRFRVQRDNRVTPAIAFEIDKIEDTTGKAALALLRLTAPYHAAVHVLKTGNRAEAGEIAHAAAKDERVPRRTRAFCWCLVAQMRLAVGDIEGSARALHYAEYVDKTCPITSLLVVTLLRSANHDFPTVEALNEFAVVRDWYRDLAAAAGTVGFLSSLYMTFSLIATERSVRSGRESAMHSFEKQLSEAGTSLENAITGTLDGIVDLDAEWRVVMYSRAARTIVKIAEDLTGQFRPETGDTPAFHEQYPIIAKQVQNLLARITATRDMIETWKPQVEQERISRMKRGEELKTSNPNLYRDFLQSIQLRELAMKQAEEVDRVGDAVDDMMDLIESKAKQLQEASDQARKWRSLEDTPFSEPKSLPTQNP